MRDYPAFLLYPEDFAAGTADMSPLEVGVYMRCLCHQWSHGFVPDDVAKIGRITGATPEEAAGAWPAVSQKFQESEPGKLQNRRMEEERQKLSVQSRKRSRAGKRGAKARWDDGKHDGNEHGKRMAKPKQNDDKQVASRVANANVNANALGTEKENDEEFPGPLPEVLSRADFRLALGGWLAYKGKKYKRTGLVALVSRAANLAKEHGVQAVIDAMERARANGWTGWDQESSFNGAKHGRRGGSARDNSASGTKGGERSL
jgi:uncharacterized protein YdaU (DUF1376 family)